MPNSPLPGVIVRFTVLLGPAGGYCCTRLHEADNRLIVSLKFDFNPIYKVPFVDIFAPAQLKVDGKMHMDDTVTAVEFC
jgi:hypothetical protein